VKLSQILVIDGNEVDASLIEKTISDDDSIYQIFTVNNVKAGHDFLIERKDSLSHSLPNLIILSDVYEDVSSIEFIEKLKESESLRILPVVVFTDPINETYIKKLYDRNVSCFIQKPEDFDAFVVTIKSLKQFWLNIVSLPQTY